METNVQLCWSHKECLEIIGVESVGCKAWFNKQHVVAMESSAVDIFHNVQPWREHDHANSLSKRTKLSYWGKCHITTLVIACCYSTQSLTAWYCQHKTLGERKLTLIQMPYCQGSSLIICIFAFRDEPRLPFTKAGYNDRGWWWTFYNKLFHRMITSVTTLSILRGHCTS